MDMMIKPIPYGKQNITEDDIQAVVDVLLSDFLTQGPAIKAFEDAFAQYVGAQYAVACANGTAALHLCTLALGVKPGDKVITTPITFAASANCVRYCGGEVVFADIDPETYLLDIKGVRNLLESSPKGTYQGVIPVDFAGRAVDLEQFKKLADEYGLWIIEDACHAPGGYFVDSHAAQQKCGNGAFADLAIFSFHPVKHIAAGEGGMVTTNDELLYKKLLMLRTHGITKDSELFENDLEFAIGSIDANSQLPTPLTTVRQATPNPSIVNRASSKTEADPQHPPTSGTGQATPQYPPWYMEMQELGYNYRLTDFQAALGLSQLKRADAGLARRKEIAATYFEAFKSVPQITDRNFEAGLEPKANSQKPIADNSHAYHLYVIEVEDRLGLYDHLRKNGIFAQIHYIPCHLMPYYRQFGWKVGDMPQAEEYYRRCISLPMYPELLVLEQEYLIGEIVNFCTKER